MNREKGVFVLFLLLISLGSSACGKSLPKLTDEQKATLSGTMQAAGRGPSAARNLSGSPVALPASSLFSKSWIASVVPSAGERDETEYTMEVKLRSAHDSRSCEINANMPAMDGGSGFDLDGMSSGSFGGQGLNMTLKVSGDTCPVNMSFEIAVQSSGSGATGTISGRYTVKDEEFAKLNDINTISLDGTIDMSGDQDSAKGGMDLKGSLVSKQYGNITFTSNMNMKASSGGNTSGEVVTDFVFPTFEAKLSEKIDGTKISYSINGEDVTEEEFQGYFKKAGIQGKGMSKGAPTVGRR